MFLKNSSVENDICLDLFAGSGVTLVACNNLNRRARIMEIDEEYCSNIIVRYEINSGEKAILLESGDA